MKRGLGRFYDYPTSLWRYFRQLDDRMTPPDPPRPVPADIPPHSASLPDIRGVVWDIYGTVCGVDLGDLEKSLTAEDRLAEVAGILLDEFDLGESLHRLNPDQPPPQTLRDLYVRGIADSHQRSRAEGIEYPEVKIERIWLDILQQCAGRGFRFPSGEPPLQTAYRCAYFFDGTLQHTYLYPQAAPVLSRLQRAGLRQGIISNAQFYTPIHLRRLLRRASNWDDLELKKLFDPPLIFFSYELGYSKPNPGAFERALTYLKGWDIRPEQVVYIGNDMLNDIWIASQCGLRTILFAGDRTQTMLRPDEPRCQDLQPDAVVHKLELIPSLLIP